MPEEKQGSECDIGLESEAWREIRRIATAVCAEDRPCDIKMGMAEVVDYSKSFPRFSEKEAIILNLLLKNDELHGMGIAELSEGNIPIGTVYVTLNRMEEKGYVASRPDTTGLPGKIKWYRITDKCRFAFQVSMMLGKALSSHE